jgi:ubiquinone/menaquinone biosynthesis C-methylase UbiE
LTVQKDPEQNETKYLKRYAEFAGKRVLEVGCGEGRLTWRYARAARHVTGVDVDHDGLRVAWIERPSDLEYIATLAEADSTSLPFHTATFDLAILAWSF